VQFLKIVVHSDLVGGWAPAAVFGTTQRDREECCIYS